MCLYFFRAAPRARPPSAGPRPVRHRSGTPSPHPKRLTERLEPLPDSMSLLTPEGEEVQVQAVMKRTDGVPLETLGGPAGDAANLPYPLPHGRRRT
jgi:hypothetical protein